MSEAAKQAWRKTKLGALATKLVNGGTPPTDVPQFWQGRYPWITGADFTESGIGPIRRFVSDDAISQTATNLINRGQLLIVTRTGVGKLAIAPIDIAISQDITGFYIDIAQATAEFLYHRLKLGLEDLKKLNQGTSINGITRGDLVGYSLEIPPIPQQRRIATILSTLDEVIAATEKLVAKHQQIKAGLMHDLFTRGLWTQAELARGDHKGLSCAATAKVGQLRPTPEEAPNLYQDSPLGLIPRAWKSELLDVLAKRGSGHTPNRHTPNFWDGGIKWVSLADSANLDQLYISETEKEISLLGIENSSAVLHPAGIVVLSRDAGVGKSAITTCPMAVSQHFMCWLCGPELDNHYLYYWLQDQKRVFENISTGTTIPTIGLGFFRRYKIAVPSDMDEQQAIRSSLLSVDETLFALQHDLAKLRQQKQGLMHDLLTGRVRVA